MFQSIKLTLAREASGENKENFLGLFGLLPKTLTTVRSKICNFFYKPYLRPKIGESINAVTLKPIPRFQICPIISCRGGITSKEMYQAQD